MTNSVLFADILDDAEKLDDEAHAELVEILTRRLAERGRQRILKSIEESRREFAAGGCRTATAKELLEEAQS